MPMDSAEAMPMPMASAEAMENEESSMLAIMDAWEEVAEQKLLVVLMSFTDEAGVLQECLDDGTQRVAAAQPAAPVPDPGTSARAATPKRRRVSKRPAAASPARSEASNKTTDSEARKVLGLAMESEPELQVLHL